jgi:hypothetical protein
MPKLSAPLFDPESCQAYLESAFEQAGSTERRPLDIFFPMHLTDEEFEFAADSIAKYSADYDHVARCFCGVDATGTGKNATIHVLYVPDTVIAEAMNAGAPDPQEVVLYLYPEKVRRDDKLARRRARGLELDSDGVMRVLTGDLYRNQRGY